MSALWRIARTPAGRFPYRVTIVEGGRTLLALLAQDRWPGASGNVFCLREREPPPGEPQGVLEAVPVVSMRRFGRRLSVTLDRARNKRCDFLFLTKRYRTRDGEYEQIFWQTQKGLSQRRPRVRFTGPRTGLDMTVWIDAHERYPWTFVGSQVERRRLPVGDYALVHEHAIHALVERKSLANLVRDLSDVRILHQTLAELGSYPASAVVVEASYADLLRSQNLGPLSVAYVSAALAELTLHQRTPLIFAGTRKLANLWARSFFERALASLREPGPLLVREALATRTASPPSRGGTAITVRKHVLEELPDRFTIQMLRAAFPGLPAERLRGVLGSMRAKGELRCIGRGRGAVWERCESAGTPPAEG